MVHGAFPDALLRQVEQESASIDTSHLVLSRGSAQVKDEAPQGHGPATRLLLEELDGAEFREFLTRVTGVEDLLDDPDHALAGVHITPPGGFTKVHRDFRTHPTTGLFHRVNVLLFLNSDWQESFGGRLELWSSDMSRLGRSILPVSNTMVIWETNDLTLHGLPDPLSCPPDRMRLSIAAYYYTREPHPDRARRERVSYWAARPGLDPPSLERGTLGDRIRRATPISIRRAAASVRSRLLRRPYA